MSDPKISCRCGQPLDSRDVHSRCESKAEATLKCWKCGVGGNAWAGATVPPPPTKTKFTTQVPGTRLPDCKGYETLPGIWSVQTFRGEPLPSWLLIKFDENSSEWKFEAATEVEGQIVSYDLIINELSMKSTGSTKAQYNAMLSGLMQEIYCELEVK